jgi:hypothetical protein
MVRHPAHAVITPEFFGRITDARRFHRRIPPWDFRPLRTAPAPTRARYAKTCRGSQKKPAHRTALNVMGVIGVMSVIDVMGFVMDVMDVI